MAFEESVATMRQHNCIFCNLEALDLIAENELAFAIRDKFPVKPLHTLIIPKRHAASIFETSIEEREAIHAIAQLCRREIEALDPCVAGFNFGSNIGEAAGQKILHTHVHLIPRRPATFRRRQPGLDARCGASQRLPEERAASRQRAASFTLLRFSSSAFRRPRRNHAGAKPFNRSRNLRLNIASYIY